MTGPAGLISFGSAHAQGVVVEGDGSRGNRREPGHRARARGAPRGARPHRGAHRAGRRARGGRRRATPRARARRRLPPPRRLRRGLRRRLRRLAPRRPRRPRHPGEQCCRVVQRDRHQLRGARRDGAQDQLLRGQDADRNAPAAVPAVAGHQPDPEHQLTAWPSQQGEQPVPEGPAPGRGEADGGGDRGHGVAVPGAGGGRDVGGAGAGLAQGVDGLLGVQAGPERLLPAAGAAAAGAGRARERQLLLPRVHAHGHDPGLGQAHRRGGGRRRRAARAAPARRAPHRHLLQVVHAAALLQAVTRVSTTHAPCRGHIG